MMSNPTKWSVVVVHASKAPSVTSWPSCQEAAAYLNRNGGYLLPPLKPPEK
jgi:hypothetical protein